MHQGELVAAALLLACFMQVLQYISASQKGDSALSAVAITQNDNIEIAVEQALACLELDPLIRGKLVAVKPNETWASAEDRTGVTQPDTLRAVLRYIKQFAPRRLVVTGGRDPARPTRSSGSPD